MGLNIVERLPSDKWRNVIYSQWVLIGLALMGALWIPESPRWLVGKGRMEKARKVLTHVYGNCEHYDIEVELQRMVEEVEYAKREKSIRASGSYRDIFRGTNFVGPSSSQIGSLIDFLGSYESSAQPYRTTSRQLLVCLSSPFTAPTSLASLACRTHSMLQWPLGEL